MPWIDYLNKNYSNFHYAMNKLSGTGLTVVKEFQQATYLPLSCAGTCEFTVLDFFRAATQNCLEPWLNHTRSWITISQFTARQVYLFKHRDECQDDVLFKMTSNSQSKNNDGYMNKKELFFDLSVNDAAGYLHLIYDSFLHHPPHVKSEIPLSSYAPCIELTFDIFKEDKLVARHSTGFVLEPPGNQFPTTLLFIDPNVGVIRLPLNGQAIYLLINQLFQKRYHGFEIKNIALEQKIPAWIENVTPILDGTCKEMETNMYGRGIIGFKRREIDYIALLHDDVRKDAEMLQQTSKIISIDDDFDEDLFTEDFVSTLAKSPLMEATTAIMQSIDTNIPLYFSFDPFADSESSKATPVPLREALRNQINKVWQRNISEVAQAASPLVNVRQSLYPVQRIPLVEAECSKQETEQLSPAAHPEEQDMVVETAHNLFAEENILQKEVQVATEQDKIAKVDEIESQQFVEETTNQQTTSEESNRQIAKAMAATENSSCEKEICPQVLTETAVVTKSTVAVDTSYSHSIKKRSNIVWNPFARLIESNLFPLARILRVSMDERLSDGFFVMNGSLSNDNQLGILDYVFPFPRLLFNFIYADVNSRGLVAGLIYSIKGLLFIPAAALLLLKIVASAAILAFVSLGIAFMHIIIGVATLTMNNKANKLQIKPIVGEIEKLSELNEFNLSNHKQALPIYKAIYDQLVIKPIVKSVASGYAELTPSQNVSLDEGALLLGLFKVDDEGRAEKPIGVIDVNDFNNKASLRAILKMNLFKADQALEKARVLDYVYQSCAPSA